MIRNLKTLGLALVAVTAMSAMFASTASATGTPFHSEAAVTSLVGNQVGTNLIHMGGKATQCNTVSFAGTNSAATQTHITVNPAFSGCSSFGFANAHVNASDCEYTIGSTGVTHSSPTTYVTGYVTIQKRGSTPNACTITITPTFFGSSVCTVNLKPNPATHYPVDLESQGAGTARDIFLTWTIANLPYEEKAGGGCGLSPASGNNGTYTGSVTTKGFSPATGAQVGVWVTD